MKIEAVEFSDMERLDMQMLALMGQIEAGTKRYRTDSGHTILVSPPQQQAGTGWHLSISHPERYPTWDEVKQARDELLPGNKTFAMLLPPDEEYVNYHNNCFHLWQVVGNYRNIDLIHKAAFGKD